MSRVSNILEGLGDSIYVTIIPDEWIDIEWPLISGSFLTGEWEGREYVRNVKPDYNMVSYKLDYFMDFKGSRVPVYTHVMIDATKFQNKEGKAPITWELDWGTETLTGKMSHPKEVTKLVTKTLPTLIKKAHEKMVKKLEPVNGFKHSGTLDGNEPYSFEKRISNDYQIELDVWDGKFLRGEGKTEAEIALLDDGGYEAHRSDRKTVILSKPDDLKKLMKTLNVTFKTDGARVTRVTSW